MSPDQATTRNRLLGLMSAADFERLASSLNWVELPKGAVIAATAGVIEHAYFLESGIGSIIVTSPEGFEVEAGLFGRDAMSPADLVLGSCDPSLSLQRRSVCEWKKNRGMCGSAA